MPDYRVATIPLSEAAATEEAKSEAITDIGFVPTPPVRGLASIPEYEAGATYAKGALVLEAGIVYRSQAAANKGNEPKADTDFVHWAPQPVEQYPLQNPAYTSEATTSFVSYLGGWSGV